MRIRLLHALSSQELHKKFYSKLRHVPQLVPGSMRVNHKHSSVCRLINYAAPHGRLCTARRSPEFLLSTPLRVCASRSLLTSSSVRSSSSTLQCRRRRCFGCCCRRYIASPQQTVHFSFLLRHYTDRRRRRPSQSADDCAAATRFRGNSVTSQ